MSSSSSPLLPPFTHVKIHDLQSAAGRLLNNLTGTVLRKNTDKECDDERYEVYLKGHDTTKSLKPANLTPVFDTYVVRDQSTIKGAGRGVFAARDIKPGEEIIVEASLVPEHCGTAAIDDLTEPDIKALNLLEAGRAAQKIELKDPLMIKMLKIRNISNHNVFEYAGTCFVCSFFNHDCDGNASYQYDVDRKCQVIYSVCAIKAGEEIFISYTGDPIPKSQRQMKLRPKGFTCQCRICSLPSDKSDKLDHLLDRFHELMDFMTSRQFVTSNVLVDQVGNEIVEISTRIQDEFQLRSMRRFFGCRLQEIFSCTAQLDVNAATNLKDPKIFERCLKWLEMYLDVFLDRPNQGQVCNFPPKCAYELRAIQRHFEFKENPFKFIPRIRNNTFPPFMSNVAH